MKQFHVKKGDKVVVVVVGGGLFTIAVFTGLHSGLMRMYVSHVLIMR